ncbi:MAG: MotA/TolQ/ExbB proton channel family protein [Bacteroidota bacterium]
MNALEMFFKGGLVMYPILLCSLAAAAIAIEKLLLLRRARLDGGQFLAGLRGLYRPGDISAVLAYCSRKEAPVAAVVRAGLLRHEQGEQRIREAIEEAGRREMYHLEKRLSLLASVAGIAPMLGFLGTVTGMVSAFRRIETLGGVVNPGDLAGGIWEALITTVFGLIVGIAAYAAYNYFVARVARFVHDLEETTSEFLEILNHPPREEGTESPQSGGEDRFFRRKGEERA